LDLKGDILTKLHTNNTTTAKLSGTGTAINPLKVDVTLANNQLSLTTSTPEVISVDNADIRHKVSGVVANKYLGFEVDQYGHIKGYTESSSSTQGVLSLDVVPGTLAMQSSNGAVVLSLPTNFNNTTTFSTGLHRITVDNYGRITAIAEEVLETLDTISSVVNSGWVSYSYTFTLISNGYLRIRYIGDLMTTYNGYGLVPLPSGITVRLDSNNLNGYANLVNNRVSGIEIRTNNFVAAGDHTLTIAVPTTVTTTGMLEIFRCR
jgi:hypothetical protein